MTSLCFSFSGQLRDRCPFFFIFLPSISAGTHPKNIYTHTLVIFPLLLYDVVWVYATIACSCQERKMGKGKRKEKTSILRGRRRSLIGRASKRKWLPFFSSPFHVFSSFPFLIYTKGDFMMAVARGRTTKKKKRGKACAHTERERKKKGTPKAAGSGKPMRGCC